MPFMQLGHHALLWFISRHWRITHGVSLSELPAEPSEWVSQRQKNKWHVSKVTGAVKLVRWPQEPTRHSWGDIYCGGATMLTGLFTPLDGIRCLRKPCRFLKVNCNKSVLTQHRTCVRKMERKSTLHYRPAYIKSSEQWKANYYSSSK